MRRKRQRNPDSPTETTDKPKSRKHVLLAVLAALLVCAAGAVVVLRSGGGAAEAAKKPEPGAVVHLDPITLNLADGHYLNVGIALQMTKADAPADGTTDPAGIGAKALDEVIAQLGERTMAELAARGGRTKAKVTLTRAVGKRYGGQVMDVYFTEFVMQ